MVKEVKAGPGQEIPRDFARDAMRVMDRLAADWDYISCEPWEGEPLWTVRLKDFDWEFRFSMSFSMMREMCKVDPHLHSVMNVGGPLAINKEPQSTHKLMRELELYG